MPPVPPVSSHLLSSVCVMCGFWKRVLEIQLWSYRLHSKPKANATKPQPPTQRPSNTLQHWVFISQAFAHAGSSAGSPSLHLSTCSSEAVQQSLPTWTQPWFSFPCVTHPKALIQFVLLSRKWLFSTWFLGECLGLDGAVLAGDIFYLYPIGSAKGLGLSRCKVYAVTE